MPLDKFIENPNICLHSAATKIKEQIYFRSYPKGALTNKDLMQLGGGVSQTAQNGFTDDVCICGKHF